MFLSFGFITSKFKLIGLKGFGGKETNANLVSKKIGKSYNMVNSYAQNRRQPSIEVLFLIAELLDVEAKELIQLKENLVKQ